MSNKFNQKRNIKEKTASWSFKRRTLQDYTTKKAKNSKASYSKTRGNFI